MPARVIRSEINSSDSLSRVSLEADLTFRALIVAVDDYGRMDARPHILKAELFPLRDELSPARVAELVAELAAIPNAPVALYEADGRPYLQLTGWDRWRGNSRRANKSRFPEFPGDSRSVPEMRGDPPVNRESGVGSRESRSESREAATGGRSRARGEDQDRGQDHALTDAKRTDLDAPRFPQPAPPETPEHADDPAAQKARDLANAAAEQWRADRLVISRGDRACQPGEWAICSPDFKARLVPHAVELGEDLAPCLKWAMADVRSGPGFPGWRTVLRSPPKVLDALQDGAMVEQWRASTASPQRDGTGEAAAPTRPTTFADGDRWRLDWPTPPGYLVASGRLRKIPERRSPPTTEPSANRGAL